jgi:hypothetical protein
MLHNSIKECNMSNKSKTKANIIKTELASILQPSSDMSENINRSMAQRLGNNEATSINHYVPLALKEILAHKIKHDSSD